MTNRENLTKVLQDKVTDYKRFAFILLALSVFLFIGLIVPTEGVSQMHHTILIFLSVFSIIFAFIFHKRAMKFQEELYSEDN